MVDPASNGKIAEALWEASMKLSPPRVITWWIAVVIGVLGILATLVTIPGLTPYAFWLVVIGFVLLAVATAVDGL